MAYSVKRGNVNFTLVIEQGLLGKCLVITLDDQTQVDSKPAGQPEHASLNQCQLIAAIRPKIGALGIPAGGGDMVSQ